MVSEISLFVLDHLGRLAYIHEHYPKMYGFLIQPETFLVIALGAAALSIVGLRRHRVETIEGSNGTRGRIGSITPLGVQFWQLYQDENLTYHGAGRIPAVILPFCHEPKKRASGEALTVEAELRFFRPNRTPLQIVGRGMWIGEDTGSVLIRAGETKYLIMAICQTDPPDPDYFLSVEDLRDFAVTRGQARAQREGVRFNHLERRLRCRVRLFVEGGRQVKIFFYTLSMGTKRISVRRESLKVRRAVCRARLRRSVFGAWYRRIRRSHTDPAVVADPTDDHSDPVP